MPDFIPYNHYIHQHDEKIRAEYAERRTADIADEVQRNYYSVSRKTKRLGVQKTKEFMRSSWQKGPKPLDTKGEERKRWKAAADTYMKAHFADTANETLAQTLGVDVKTIRRWARRLCLQKTEAFMQQSRAKGCCKPGGRPFYTTEQEAWRRQRIAAVYPDGSEEKLQALAKELGIKRNTLSSTAWKYGIFRSEEKVKEILSEQIKKACVARMVFTPALIAEIAAYYPTHTTAECAAHFGVNLGSLKQVAFKHKWRKDKEYLHSIRQRFRKNAGNDNGLSDGNDGRDIKKIR